MQQQHTILAGPVLPTELNQRGDRKVLGRLESVTEMQATLCMSAVGLHIPELKQQGPRVGLPSMPTWGLVWG